MAEKEDFHKLSLRLRRAACPSLPGRPCGGRAPSGRNARRFRREDRHLQSARRRRGPRRPRLCCAGQIDRQSVSGQGLGVAMRLCRGPRRAVRAGRMAGDPAAPCGRGGWQGIPPCCAGGEGMGRGATRPCAEHGAGAATGRGSPFGSASSAAPLASRRRRRRRGYSTCTSGPSSGISLISPFSISPLIASITACMAASASSGRTVPISTVSSLRLSDIRLERLR